jgi:hypothetical protein
MVHELDEPLPALQPSLAPLPELQPLLLLDSPPPEDAEQPLDDSEVPEESPLQPPP